MKVAILFLALGLARANEEDDDDWLGDIIPAVEMPILYADVEVCLTDLSEDGVSMESVTDGCLNTAICPDAASLGTEIESWLQSQNSLLSDLSLAALVQSGIECVCSIDTTAPEYDATLTAVIDLVEDYSEAALASFFNYEVPALIGAISGGLGLCTPECKAFASEAILVPTQLYTSSSTMAGLWEFAYEAFESWGVGEEVSWLTGMPTAFTIDMRLANIAAANLPDCLCGVDYVNLYNIIKPTVVSLVTDFESWFENDAFQISTWTAIVSSYNTAVKDTGLGFCSNTCKQGVESFLAHQLEVFMGLAGLTGGIAGLGLAGYSVTDTTVSTVVTSCGCQKTEALISAAITTFESFQPLVDLLIDGIDDAGDVQSVLNSVVDDDLKAHVKTILAALFADDAACATDCQNAAANLAEIGQALAFDQTTLALIVGDDFDLSEWVPSTSQAAIATAGANALPCLCAETTDPTAAVDAVWAPVVETLVHDIEGLFEGGLTGQQFSSMLVAVSSVPANMGMCASSSCTALLSAGNTLITDLHVTLDGTPPAAQCTEDQAAACMTDAAIISKSSLEEAYNAWPSLCQIQDGLTLHPIWWVGCAFETACDSMRPPPASPAPSPSPSPPPPPPPPSPLPSPPPSAPPPPVVLILEAEGTYDELVNQTEELRASVAALAGVPAEYVTIIIEGGGGGGERARRLSEPTVTVTAEISMPPGSDPVAVQATVAQQLSDPAAASAYLGIPVASVTVIVAAPPSTPPPPPPSPSGPPPDESSGMSIALIGGVAGGAVGLLLGVLCVIMCMRNKKKKRGDKVGATPL